MGKLEGFPLLVATNEKAAREKIFAALFVSEGNRTHAAKALGVTARSLLRIIERLDMWGDVDKMCKKNGFYTRRGRRRGAYDPSTIPKNVKRLVTV